ncbi:MAG: MOSC domain-containing protein, partial [Bacteroidia bacterium]|nr:MOSC domain-containing protein [Bacteroidia bacterium]
TMIIGQSSLDDLNERLAERLPMNRFRPNIVFTGGEPYEEDILQHFMINRINFFGVKLSARCVIINTDQDDATLSKEPLKTLATFRSKDNKVYFGQNLLHQEEGIIHIGDMLDVITRKKNLLEIVTN